MLFRQIFDPHLAQYAYLIGCQKTKTALVIDPERDIDRYVEAAGAEGLTITAVAETHIHADFLSGAREFAKQHGVKVYLSGEGGPDWTYGWGKGYDVELLRDGDTFAVGNIKIKAVHTPGHTPEHLSFLITDEGGGADEPLGLASGDFVFVGDLGRPDLLETAAGQEGAQEPAAHELFDSLQKLKGLPDFLQIWPGHGAGSACGKALGAVPQSTLGYEMKFNAAVQAAKEGEDAFVKEILEGQPEPPLYFARMKRQNKQGPSLLGALPRPRSMMASALGTLCGCDDCVVIDTRPRSVFVRGHLPASLLAPLDDSFPTVAGSYVPAGTPIYLVVEHERAEEAVRALVRIGLDDVRGVIEPRTLESYGDGNDKLNMLKTIDFDEVDGRRHYTNAAVLDVRRQEEWDQKHLPGAIHIPHVRLLDRLDELPRDKTLLVHCQSGVRSAVASALLAAHGFCVAYVDDAFENWKERHRQEGVEAGAH
ncbi:MAG: rhodanese-like domain-containing protein [Rhodothermales bacterium]